MGDNWDDDDFEPEVSNLAPPPVEEEDAVPVVQSNAPKQEKKKNTINMESLGRELTAAEREELQRRNELKMTREMFGLADDDESEEGRPYADILEKDEFEEWGQKIGTFLATRHAAAHYGDLVNKLIITVSEKLGAAEVRKISTHLKALADAKKEEKPKGGAAGKKKKVQLKSNKAAGSMYDDFGGGKGGVTGGYDDLEDDFM